MKASYLKVVADTERQFYCSYLDLPRFDHPWHFHPEFELTLILEGSGIRYVGDSTERFRKGDLILLGPNVPHLWQNGSSYLEHTRRSRALVLQVHPDFLATVFKNFQDLQPLVRLFGHAERGVCFSKGTSEAIVELFMRLYHEKGLRKWAAFFDLLVHLSEVEDYTLLASNGYVPQVNNKDFDVMNQIFNYVKDNIDSRITLQEMADLVHFTKHSFCRYFKQKTGMSFFTFLNEYRINQAKRILLEKQYLSIREVALMCGFPSVQHFNSKFKALNQGRTPSRFLKDYVEVETKTSPSIHARG